VAGSLLDESNGRAALASRLRALSDENICIGGNSWKDGSWLGQIYSRERYLSRGRFSPSSSKPNVRASPPKERAVETFQPLQSDLRPERGSARIHANPDRTERYNASLKRPTNTTHPLLPINPVFAASYSRHKCKTVSDSRLLSLAVDKSLRRLHAENRRLGSGPTQFRESATTSPYGSADASAFLVADVPAAGFRPCSPDSRRSDKGESLSREASPFALN
jgi:hypothetical protein